MWVCVCVCFKDGSICLEPSILLPWPTFSEWLLLAWWLTGASVQGVFSSSKSPGPQMHEYLASWEKAIKWGAGGVDSTLASPHLTVELAHITLRLWVSGILSVNAVRMKWQLLSKWAMWSNSHFSSVRCNCWDLSKDLHGLWKSDLSDMQGRGVLNFVAPVPCLVLPKEDVSAEWLASPLKGGLCKLQIYHVPTKGVIVFVNLSINYMIKIWIIEQNSFNGLVIIYQVNKLQF